MSHRNPSVLGRRGLLARTVRIAGLAAGLAVATGAGPALAQSGQSACLANDKLTQMLEASGRLFEVFAAEDGATWTMVITTPEGASCVIAVGEEWQTPQQLAFDPEM